MTVCSFIGNNKACDWRLYARLRTVLKALAEENDRVAFLLSPQYGNFFNNCLRAAVETRSHYPQRVKIILVSNNNIEDRNFLAHDTTSVPACMVDYILTPGMTDSKSGRIYPERITEIGEPSEGLLSMAVRLITADIRVTAPTGTIFLNIKKCAEAVTL